jgi:spermidine synthase
MMSQGCRAGAPGYHRHMANAKRTRIFTERLNPHLGFFYTVKKTLLRTVTPFQKLELIDTDAFGKVLLLDGVTQVTERNEFQYHEPMVHPAMIAHHRPERVLVIGGGDGGILREVIKYRSVKSVVLAELDEDMVRFSKKHLGVINNGAFSDKRVTTVFIDGRKYVEENPKSFDVVIMDMTDPFGPSTMLYTADFFGLVKRSFRDRHGIFTMHSSSPMTRPLAFASIVKTLGSVFSNVSTLFTFIEMYATLWSISVASDTADLCAARPADIDRKLRACGIRGLEHYTGATHQAMLAEYPFLTKIRSHGGRIITDRDPTFPDHFTQDC